MTTQSNEINISKDFIDIFTPYVMNLLEARLTDTYEIYEFSAQYFEEKIKERQRKSPRSKIVAEEVKCVSQDVRREFKKETRKKIWERDISSKKGPLDILPDLEYDSAIEFNPMSCQDQCSNNFQKFLFDKELSSEDKHFTLKSSALQGLSTPTTISKVLQHLSHIPGYIAALTRLIEELPEDSFTQDAINNFMHCECFIWKLGKCSQHSRSTATQTEIQGMIEYPKKEEFQNTSKDEKITFGYIRDIMRKAKYFVQSIENQAHFRVANNKNLKYAGSHRGKIKNIACNVEKCSKSVANAKDVIDSLSPAIQNVIKTERISEKLIDWGQNGYIENETNRKRNVQCLSTEQSKKKSHQPTCSRNIQGVLSLYSDSQKVSAGVSFQPNFNIELNDDELSRCFCHPHDVFKKSTDVFCQCFCHPHEDRASITSSVRKKHLSDSIQNVHLNAVGSNTYIRSGSLGHLKREPYQLSPFDNRVSDEETNKIPKYKVKMLKDFAPEKEKNSRYKRNGARYMQSNSIDYHNITGINHCYLLCDIEGRHWLRTFLSYRKLRRIVDDANIKTSAKDLGTPVMILRFFSVRTKSSLNRSNFNFVRAWYFSRSLRSLHKHHSK